MDISVLGSSDAKAAFDMLCHIIATQRLPLALTYLHLDKLSDKNIAQHCQHTPTIALIKHTPHLIKADHHTIIKSHLNWQSLTHRIVSAGRKSELLLQACKLTHDQCAIDATAGFGHDGLLLASTGAQVMMIEKNPIIALLLYYEYQQMLTNKNWVKLLDRISIRHGDFINMADSLDKADVVYLDPMFPTESYTAKVNKNMQLLHDLAPPPTSDEQKQLLDHAIGHIYDHGKVIVKRPIGAPHLADRTPVQSYANDAIRFDRYDHMLK